jgi:hypothetical protein
LLENLASDGEIGTRHKKTVIMVSSTVVFCAKLAAV